VSGYHKNALPRGHELAEYTIESVLGHGGFGVTYLAKDTRLGAMVAIKEYLPHDLATRNEATKIIPDLDAKNAVKDYHWGLKRFLKEAQALARFKHPNIVRVLRYMEANGTAYMVMEYEAGQSLGQYLREHGNKMKEGEVLKIMLPILNGLEAVHNAGLLHLDIKPDNIYLRRDHTPMLIDFGSARQALSGSQRIVLTPGYAPIEQYPDKGERGPWTDIYAIGASMYRCLEGKRPSDSLDRYQMILKYKADPMTPVEKIAGGRVAQNTVKCMDWALQCYPTDRPRSAKKFQDALLGRTAVSYSCALPIEVKGEEVRSHVHVDRAKQLRLLKPVIYTLILSAVFFAILYFWKDILSYLPAAKVLAKETIKDSIEIYHNLKNIFMDFIK
jgi:serine/threonine protein kinase